jgi:hypothetical protein
MKIAICTNLDGGIGLQREYELLCEFLRSLGHTVAGIQYDAEIPAGERADLMISLETVARHHLPVAPIHWWFPNPEWVTTDLIPVADRVFQKIFTKTREAQRMFEPLFPGRVFYTGFLVRDPYDATIPRVRSFLHIGGNGSLRNTQAVIDAWKWAKDGKSLDAPLIVVSRIEGLDLRGSINSPGVMVLKQQVTDSELESLQNSCLFHLYPSATEGFGHAIREGMMCSNIVLTTAAPPMDEIDAMYHVTGVAAGKFHMATTYDVSALDIYAACRDMLSSGPGVLFAADETPRERILRDNERFRETFAQHVKAVNPNRPAPKWKRNLDGVKSIAFLGNFTHSFSTESDLAWSFEYEGHEVIRLQENTIGLRGLEEAFTADLFLWVRTPDWLRVPDDEMYKFLEKLRSRGVASASFHLDKFWGILERETLIGTTPFWITDYVFTADGGYGAAFAKRGVNHRWLPPGVVLRGCYPGTPDPSNRIDVGFVGATTGYHECYPERQTLVGYLQKTFGNRFRIFSGFREQALNDLYASIKVVVGDSIFANQPPGLQKYWSDRVPETMGRGGVLVHPHVEGLDIMGNGLLTYEPGNWDDLANKIDILLSRPSLRRDCRNCNMDVVRKRHTYTNRVKSILDAVFP